MYCVSTGAWTVRTVTKKCSDEGSQLMCPSSKRMCNITVGFLALQGLRNNYRLLRNERFSTGKVAQYGVDLTKWTISHDINSMSDYIGDTSSTCMLILGPQYNAVGIQLKFLAFHTLTCASVFSSHTDSLRSGCHYMLRPAVFTPLRVTCGGLPHSDRPCLARHSVVNTPAGSVIQLSLPDQACVPNALISIQCACIGSIQRCPC